MSRKGRPNMPKKTLKAFIVTYYLNNEDNPRSCAIVAYDKKEAGDIFIKWLNAKHMYEVVTSLVVQPTRKTRRNKHMFTIEFYNRQNAFVNELLKKANKGA